MPDVCHPGLRTTGGGLGVGSLTEVCGVTYGHIYQDLLLMFFIFALPLITNSLI